MSTTSRAIPVMFYVVSEKLAWAMRGNGSIRPSQGRLYGMFSTRERAEEFVTQQGGPLVQSRIHIVQQ